MKHKLDSFDFAQGTIEYLVIIGIVVVISLVVVGVLVSQTSSATNVSTTSSKISALVGEISLIDSGVSPDGNYLVVLKSNIVGAITVTNVKVGDYNRNFSEQLNQSSTQNFVVFGPTCSLGEKKSLSVSVIYSDQYGLSHTQIYPTAVSFSCDNYSINSGAGQVTPPVTPPQTGSGDTTAPTILLSSPVQNFSGSGVVDFNFLASDNNAILRCVLRIDGVDRNSWSKIDTNTYNVLKFNITSLSEGVHAWDVNCLDFNSNWGTYAGTDWNVIYDIVAGRNVYFSTGSDFNAGAYLLNTAVINPPIKPMGELDWNINDGAARIDGLVAQYKMNDNAASTTVVDSVGGYNGTSVRASSLMSTMGKINTSLSFNGSDKVAISNGILNFQKDFTVSTWVYVTSWSANETALFGYSTTGTNYAFLHVAHGDNISFGTYTSSGGSGINSAQSLSLNTWYHVAVVRSGSTGKIYLNGVEQTTTGGFNNTNIPTSMSNMTLGTLGGYYESGRFLNGKLDDVRFYSNALSAVDINAIYNSTNGTEQNGRGNWTDQNLVAYYKFDTKNGTTIFDSARGNSGTLTNGADITAQALWDTNGLYLDGVDDYVTVPDNSSLQGFGSMTVSLWMNGTSFSSVQGFVNKHRATYTTNTWTFRTLDANPSQLYFASFGANCSNVNLYINGTLDGTGTTSATSTKSFLTNVWYHIAVTASGCTNLGSNSYPLGIGYLELTSGGNVPSLFFKGKIENLKIYSRPLSATEIQADYNRGLFDSNYVSRIIDTNSGYMGVNGTDYNYLTLNTNTGADKNGHIYGTQIEPTVEKDLNSGLLALWHFNGNALDSSIYGRNATVNGATSTTGKFSQGYAITNGQYITPPSGTAPTGAITISEWFKLSGSAFALYDFGVTSGCYPSNQYFMVDSNKLYWQIGCGNLFYGNTTISYNIWQHAVMTVDGSNNVKLYLNGVLDGSGTRNISASSGNDQIGASYSGGTVYTVSQGSVDEVAIWNRALDANEVKELFNKGASRIGVRYRSCESSSSCTRSWSDMNYLTGSNQVNLNALDGNQFMQYALYPNLLPSSDGNYLPQAFATIWDVNLIYSN